MSVIIKGMKIPDGCAECTFYSFSGDQMDDARCRAKTRTGRKLPRNYNLHDWKPEWCPLVDLVECQECKYAHMTYNGEVKYCDVWFDEDPVYADGDYYCGSGERK